MRNNIVKKTLATIAINVVKKVFLFNLNGPFPASFPFIFGLFQTNITIFGIGILTHNLQDMSLFTTTRPGLPPNIVHSCRGVRTINHFLL